MILKSERYTLLFTELRAELGVDEGLPEGELECLYFPTFHARLALRLGPRELLVASLDELDFLSIPMPETIALLASLRAATRVLPPEPVASGRDGMVICARLGSTQTHHIRATVECEPHDRLLRFAGQLLDVALARLQTWSPNHPACTAAKTYLRHGQ